MNRKLLEEFSKVAINVGVNVKKGQKLVISSPVEAYDFVRILVKDAYEKGAEEVIVKYNDSEVSKLSLQNEDVEVLSVVKDYRKAEIEYFIEKGACTLHVISEKPGLYDGIDPQKLAKVFGSIGKEMQKYAYYSMNNIGQWSIVAYPNAEWAKKVFPDLEEKEAVSKLWDAIFYTSRISEENSIDAWKKHNENIKKYSSKMNEYNFKSLHFKNSLGTDIEIGLVKDHIWEGGSSVASINGQEFNPNIPTEEVFTMPDRLNVNGVVYSSKPLDYHGTIIDKFKLIFKDGKVVESFAEVGNEFLDNLLNSDEGSRHIGEIALISHNSPISNLNILFINTLFDENASCHMALGKCYPTNIKGGVNMSDEELLEKGGNSISINHVDFMFGTEDMEIIGIKENGEKVQVFKSGNFVI